MFCNLIGAAGELQKSDPAQKCYTSEARPSFHWWGGWQAKPQETWSAAIFVTQYWTQN